MHNSCASLAGLVLSFIACFILNVIAPLSRRRRRRRSIDKSENNQVKWTKLSRGPFVSVMCREHAAAVMSRCGPVYQAVSATGHERNSIRFASSFYSDERKPASRQLGIECSQLQRSNDVTYNENITTAQHVSPLLACTSECTHFADFGLSV